MASTKFKKRDLNRYRKIYPYIRREPRFVTVSENDVLIEIGEITFTDSSTGTYTFTETFASAPVVTAITYDSEGNDSANVNAFISSLTTASVTIDTSQNFTGKIQFHAIWIES